MHSLHAIGYTVYASVPLDVLQKKLLWFSKHFTVYKVFLLFALLRTSSQPDEVVKALLLILYKYET